MKTYKYICECRDVSCRGKVIMTFADFREASKKGPVISEDCPTRKVVAAK